MAKVNKTILKMGEIEKECIGVKYYGHLYSYSRLTC